MSREQKETDTGVQGQMGGLIQRAKRGGGVGQWTHTIQWDQSSRAVAYYKSHVPSQITHEETLSATIPFSSLVNLAREYVLHTECDRQRSPAGPAIRNCHQIP